jgi:hypothetical protein
MGVSHWKWVPMFVIRTFVTVVSLPATLELGDCTACGWVTVNGEVNYAGSGIYQSSSRHVWKVRKLRYLAGNHPITGLPFGCVLTPCVDECVETASGQFSVDVKKSRHACNDTIFISATLQMQYTRITVKCSYGLALGGHVVRSDAIGWGIALQAGRLRVRFLIAGGSTQSLAEMSTSGVKAAGA